MIAGGGDTDDRHGMAVEQHRLIEDAGVAVEAGLPVVVSENYYRVGPGKQVGSGSGSGGAGRRSGAFGDGAGRRARRRLGAADL